MQRLAHRQCRHLHAAGVFQQPHQHEGLADAATGRQHAVVAQHQHFLVAKVRHQALLLAIVDGQALELVVRHLTGQLHRVLIDVQQAGGAGGNRLAGHGVGVHDAAHVVAGGVDRAVDDVAGAVHARLTDIVADQVAVQIDLEQVGGRDLVVHQAEVVDQKMIVLARHAGGDVIENQHRPAEAVGQAVGGGKLHPRLPFLGRALIGADADRHFEVTGLVHGVFLLGVMGGPSVAT